jgi:hypothetical protein
MPIVGHLFVRPRRLSATRHRELRGRSCAWLEVIDGGWFEIAAFLG